MGMIAEPVLRRSVAFLSDQLLISVLFTAATAFLPDSPPVQWPAAGIGFPVEAVLYGVLTAAYFFSADLLNRGNSPGKEILRLRTLGPDGNPPPLSVCLMRTVLKLVSISVLPVSIAVYVWKGRQVTLQDRLCHTSLELINPDGGAA